MTTSAILMCRQCGFIYEESMGAPESGISPGTDFDAAPDDRHCPECGGDKTDFQQII